MTTDERLERMEKSIGDLTRHMLELRAETSNLTRYVLELRTETANHMEIIENRLEVLGVTILSLDSRMIGLTKAALDWGAIATRLQREQTRIAKLVEPAA
jgi:hypothetical protein